MRIPTYVEPLLSSIFLTSATIHVITTRRANLEDRNRLTAQSTILSDLITRMRAGERIHDEEYERLVGLARRGQYGSASEAERLRSQSGTQEEAATGGTSWKEVLKGRNPTKESAERLEEQAAREWEEALRLASEPPKATPIVEPEPSYTPQPLSTPAPSTSQASDPQPSPSVLSRRYL